MTAIEHRWLGTGAQRHFFVGTKDYASNCHACHSRPRKFPGFHYALPGDAPAPPIQILRTDSFNNEIRRTDRLIEQKEARLEQFEDRQRARFAALESLLSQLQSQGAALSAFQFPRF